MDITQIRDLSKLLQSISGTVRKLPVGDRPSHILTIEHHRVNKLCLAQQ